MNLYFSQFITGLNHGLSKRAYEENIFDIGGSIFPTLENQAKWQFARSDNNLQLHDGNNVYNFHMPEGYKEHEDFPMQKENDTPAHEFGRECHTRGTLQVHRADPGSIYFTIQDGHTNPTYTVKHVNGNQWRAIPKNKSEEKSMEINHEHFMKGAMDKLAVSEVMDGLLKGVDWTARNGYETLMKPGYNPAAAAGVGLLGGAAYDLVKRHLYNTPEENDEESFGERLSRYAVPSVGLGLLGQGTRSAIPNYYTQGHLQHPTYDVNG